MLQLTLTDGQVVKFDNFDESLDADMLDPLFAGDCSARKDKDDNSLDYIELTRYVWEQEEQDKYMRVVKSEWIDDFPETNLHEYVLDELNTNQSDWAFSWANGENSIDKPIGFITEHWRGFQDAVNAQINLDGLEHVIGFDFDLSRILNLVITEIVQSYLRAVNLY